MNKVKHAMKFRLLAFILSAGLCMAGCIVNAQSFIRIYDHQGKKIGKGNLKGYTDSSLVIRFDNKTSDTFLESNMLMLSFVAGGVIVGDISGIATKRQKFFVHGDLEEWRIAKAELFLLSPNDILFMDH